MTYSFTLEDVPTVSEFELSIPMKLLIDGERALCLMKGAKISDRRAVETAFWETFKGPTERGVAILVRFWCLVDAFTSQRLKALLLNRGYRLLGPAVGAAAKLRLNASWGFNPQRLMWGIQDVEARGEQALANGSIVKPVAPRSSIVKAYISEAA